MEDNIDLLEEVTVPDLEEIVESVTIVFWHAEAGDIVEVNDNLVDIQVKKSIVTIKAHESGMLHEVFFDEGDEVMMDEVIATIVPEI